MAALSLGVAYFLFFSSLLGFGLFVLFSARRVSLRRLLSPGPWFLSARESVGWGPLGLSLYASFMGNWVLYLPALAGALYGWAGVGGYALSSCLPYLLLLVIAPHVCKGMKGGGGAFCSCDYIGDRFGPVARGVSAGVSVCMMFLNLCSELTTVGLSMAALSDQRFSLPVAVVFVALVPLVYVGLGGVKCSIISDVLQALLIVALFIPLTVYLLCFAGGDGAVSSEETAEETAGPGVSSAASLIAGAVLVLSIWPAFLCDQGIWQRLLASRSKKDMQLGLLLAAGLAGASVLLFGAAGNACLSLQDVQQQGGGSLFAFAAEHVPQGWTAVLCLLAVACVTSSVDTYQVAAVSVMGRELERRSCSFNWARLAMLLLNIPAVAIAVCQISLMTLFMAANFCCAILAGPFLLSIHPKATRSSFLGGLLAAVGGLLLCALAAAKTQGQPFSLAFFAPEDISTLPYLIAFLVAPLAGAAGTAIIFLLQVQLSKRAAAAGSAAAAAANKSSTEDPQPAPPRESPTGLTTKEYPRLREESSSNSNSSNNGSNSSSCKPMHSPDMEMQAAGVASMA